jgi:hypothetical protein
MYTPSHVTAARAAVSRLTANIAAAGELHNDYWTVPMPAKLESGAWRIERFTIPHPLPRDICLKNFQHIAGGQPEFVVSPGTYHRLVGPCGDDGEDGVMMSNTQLEYRTNLDFVNAAKGDVFIAGLGLGMLFGPLLANPAVKSITVVELEQDVINMVRPRYLPLTLLPRAPRLHIHHNDAKNYVPDHDFDAIMLDIWPDVSCDNLPEMEEMKTYYRQFLRPGGYIECWSEPLARRQQAQLDSIAAEFESLRSLTQ